MDVHATYGSYGLTPSKTIMDMQKEANAEAVRSYKTSSLSNITYATAVDDAQDALVGLMADLSGTTERHSLKDMLMHKDRMRGLGFLLIALALVGLVADYMMHASA